MGIRIPVEDSAPSVAFEDAVASVFEALGEVPEFRDPRGKQVELEGTPGLAAVAMTAGHTSYRRIGTYGKPREETLIPLLGLERAPSDSTIRSARSKARRLTHRSSTCPKRRRRTRASPVTVLRRR